MKLAVLGGTGVVGRHVVAVAESRGHRAVSLSRAGGVDVSTGAGLVEGFEGCAAVIDVSNTTTLSARRATTFFTTSTGHALAAEEAVGVRHHVVLSIVGIDGIDAGYYAGKLAQERAVEAGKVPFTIVRAAQFHEFAGQVLGQVPGPIALVPRMPMRPVAAREVAEYLIDCVEAGPRGRVRDLVGPRDEQLVDLARRQLGHDGERRRVFEVRMPGAYGRGLASGALRGTAAARHGTQTFEEWLR